ncbi:MAG: amidase [Bryobacterales bacterium]|nr:amidase [Bryobacterales bacterium]
MMPSFPWSLRQISSLLAQGDLSPLDVLQATSAAIERAEPAIRAWCHLSLKSAWRQAEMLTDELRRSKPRSALHGTTYGAKDIFDTAGMPTEWGSPTQRGRVPGEDCQLVGTLRSLGFVLAGKTHTTAYAYYDTGPTRNPCSPGHTPGGSSSGSAAAVAAGMVPLALGTQTKGSVLRPASFCGVAGFKPSFGCLPLAGVMPLAPTLDHAGLFAASAADMEFAWRELAAATEQSGAEGLSVIDWPPDGRPDPEMSACFRAAARTLAGAGVPMRRVPRPEFFDALPAALHAVMAYEAAREHGQRYREHGPDMGEKLAALLEDGLRVEPRGYACARQVLRTAREAYRDWAREHPVVATPAALGPAPKGLESSGDPRCNAPFTALGAPAISIPMPTEAGQLPLGMQLTAAPGRDGLLLASAAACERLLGERS